MNQRRKSKPELSVKYDMNTEEKHQVLNKSAYIGLHRFYLVKTFFIRVCWRLILIGYTWFIIFEPVYAQCSTNTI